MSSSKIRPAMVPGGNYQGNAPGTKLFEQHQATLLRPGPAFLLVGRVPSTRHHQERMGEYFCEGKDSEEEGGRGPAMEPRVNYQRCQQSSSEKEKQGPMLAIVQDRKPRSVKLNTTGQTRYYEILRVTNNKKYNSVNDIFALGNVAVDAAVKQRQEAKSRSLRQ